MMDPANKFKKHLVSAPLLEAARKAADSLMEKEPGLRERWLDENQTSAVTKAKGGWIHMETDYDWILAFFAWYVDNNTKFERV